MPASDTFRRPVGADMASEAGRGFVWITAAKFYFLATATLSALVFPRLFGDPVLFGRYRVVSGLLNVFTMVVITATVQGVSRLCSEEGAFVRGARVTATRVQTALFGPVFVVLLVASGLIARSAFGDDALADPIRAASFVVIAYAYYAVLVGILNGTRRFASQAGLDATFSTLKTGLMIGTVAVTGSVTAAFASFSTAAVLVLLAALVVARPVASPDETGVAPPPSRYLAYVLPLGAYALFLNLLLQADILGLKVALGRLGAADFASQVAGIYGAAKNVATIPYQAVISLTFVVFPFVSGATSRDDQEAALAVVRGAMRLCAVLSCAAVVILVPAGGDFLALLFGEPYRAGGPWLLPLLGGVTTLAFLVVANAILASAGRPIASLYSGAVAVVIQAALLGLLLGGEFEETRGGISDVAGWSAALATLAGCVFGAAVSLWLLCRKFPSARWEQTALMAVGGAVLALALDSVVLGSLPWPVRSTLSFAVFFAALIATRAVGLDDFRALRSVLGRRRR